MLLVWRCGALSEFVGMLPECRGTVEQDLTLLPQCGTDDSYFLDSILQQLGHLGQCRIAFGAIPGFRSEQMHVEALPAGDGDPLVYLLNGERLQGVVGVEGHKIPPLGVSLNNVPLL